MTIDTPNRFVAHNKFSALLLCFFTYLPKNQLITQYLLLLKLYLLYGFQRQRLWSVRERR